MRAISLGNVASRAEKTAIELCRWWLASLAGVLPTSWRDKLTSLRTEHFLDVTAEGCTLRRRRGKSEDVVHVATSRNDESSSADLRTRNVRCAKIRLDPVLVFTRRITLPLAAEKNLGAILRNEIDRITPFSSDATYFDFRINHRDRTAGKLDVALTVAKREVIDGPLRVAGGAGITITRAMVGGSDHSQLTGIDLLHFARYTKRSLWTYANATLAFAAILLAGLFVTAAYDRLDSQIGALSQDVAQTRAQATEASELKKKLALATSQHAVLDQRKLGPAPLSIIRDLTQALSDKTWVSQMQINEREVQLSGFSKDAATVLTDLQEAKTIRNPRFRSPLTQSGEWERFDVTVDLPAGGVR